MTESLGGIRIKEVNERALFATDSLVSVGHDSVDLLKQRAEANRLNSIRLCTHQDAEDALHEMFIVNTQDTYVRPHKQLKETKSFHVIEGLMDMVVFDEDGNIVQAVSMGDHSTGKPFYFRLSDIDYYHTLLFRSDVVLFLETTNGPARSSDVVFPPWAPAGIDDAARRAYLEQLEKDIRNFMPGVG